MIKNYLKDHNKVSFILSFSLGFIVGLGFYLSDKIDNDTFLQLTYNILQSSISLLVMVMVIFIFVAGHIKNEANELHNKNKNPTNYTEESISEAVKRNTEHSNNIQRLNKIMDDTSTRSTNLLLFIAVSIILTLSGLIIEEKVFQIYGSLYLGGITFTIMYLIFWAHLVLSQWKKILIT